MSTTKEASERSIQARLGQAGAKIDGIVAKARHAHDDGKSRVGRRVDALRAREARTRTRLRELHQADQAAWDAHVAELDRELDELEVEMAIAEARLNAELAADDAAFAAAVDAELDAWSGHIEVMQARAAAAKQHARTKREAAILRVRERRTAARHQLQAFRKGASKPTPARRAEVTHAMDDLDRAADEAAAEID
jgi:recombination DNA repair RAD52 pathway protein